MVNGKLKILLDTDLGSDVDDALALAVLLGSKNLSILGVSTVYGDTDLRARIVKRLGRLGGHDLAVYAGTNLPLSGRDIWWSGKEGSNYLDLDSEMYEGEKAVSFLIRTVMENPGEIDLIAIGPLTNIARAIAQEREFANNLKHLWIMGGNFGIEKTEHNFKCDSVAAQAVFASDAKITVTDLVAANSIKIFESEILRIGRAGQLGVSLGLDLRLWLEQRNQDWTIPHDPIAALTLLTPDNFAFSEPGYVKISTAKDENEGLSEFFPDVQGNVRVASPIHREEIVEEMISRIESAGGN